MHYAVGQEVYGGHRIDNIIQEGDEYHVYIQKGDEVLPWKSFNQNMAIAVENSLEY